MDFANTYLMLIHGELVGADDGEVHDSFSPATEKRIGRAAWGSAVDASRAVDSAQAAAPQWSDLKIAERAARLREFAAILRDSVEALASLECADVGNPIDVVRNDVRSAADAVEYFANLASELKGETIPSPSGGWHFTVREPYGVVARIVPFNHPLLFAASKVAAPLAAGNTVILAAPPQAPLSSLLMGEIVKDVFPPGVLNILAGDGSVVGHGLVTDRRVFRVGFTGSAETGKSVVRESADHLPEVTLELGGKNPLIVFPDADVPAAAAAAVNAMNFRW